MRFTIKLKLALAFSVIILLLIGATGYGVASLAGMNSTMTDLISGPVARMHLAGDARAQLLEIVRAEKNADDIANGDVSVQPKPLSDQDVLGQAMERVTC